MMMMLIVMIRKWPFASVVGHLEQYSAKMICHCESKLLVCLLYDLDLLQEQQGIVSDERHFSMG